MANKICKRSYNASEVMDNFAYEKIRDINTPMAKTASVKVRVVGPNKVAMRDAGGILRNAVSHGYGVKEAADGSVWRVATIDGEEYLIRDDEWSQDSFVVQELMGG